MPPRAEKSERLKKLENELQDLEQWMKLGLVPKKDMVKHQEEIDHVREKIDEERERLRYLKETGDAEEYTAPKRAAGGRSGYQTEMPTIPDIDFGDGGGGAGNDSYEDDSASDSSEKNSQASTSDDSAAEEDDEEDSNYDGAEEESFFSERRGRWRNEGILDPEADDW